MDEKEIRKRLAGRAAEYMMFRDDEEENAKTTAEVSSSDNVIVFPDFEKLKSEVEKMRTELSMLLLERDELQFVICKNIETEYMLRYKVWLVTSLRLSNVGRNKRLIVNRCDKMRSHTWIRYFRLLKSARIDGLTVNSA